MSRPGALLAMRPPRDVQWVVSPRRGPALRVAATLALVVLLGAGAAGGWLHGFTSARGDGVATPADDPTQALRDALAKAEAALQLEQARSRELERQIDALNRRLVETQEELSFFRKSRDERKP